VNTHANIHAYMWNVISDHFHEDIDTLSNKYHLQYVNDPSPTCRYLFLEFFSSILDELNPSQPQWWILFRVGVVFSGRSTHARESGGDNGHNVKHLR
jgi:hypothetical protein